MYNTSSWRDHHEAVAAITAAGINPPKKWTDINQNFTKFYGIHVEVSDTLAAAVIDGRFDEVPTLKSLALAEAMGDSVSNAAVRNAVEQRVLTALQDVYNPTVPKAYTNLADLFDAHTQRLIAAIDTVHPDTDPNDIVGMGEDARNAWAAAPLIARDINALIPALQEAAWLLGLSPVRTPEVTAALLTDPADVDRRDYWQAWDAGGRCGKWAALHTLGVTLRAHRDPTNLQPYTRPAELVEHWHQTGRGTWERAMVDPDTGEVTTTEHDRRNPTPGAVEVGAQQFAHHVVAARGT